jgi:hypothetical protein
MPGLNPDYHPGQYLKNGGSYLPDKEIIPLLAGICTLPDSVSFVGTVPVLIFLMTGETVQYVCPILADIVDYSRLFCYFLNMAGDAMFHMFAGRAGIEFLKMHEEHGFHIPGHICQLFPGGI